MYTEAIFGQLLVNPEFFQTLADLKQYKITTDNSQISYQNYNSDEVTAFGKITPLEKFETFNLDAEDGYSTIFSMARPLCAYDESMISIPALEGTGYFFVHSLVLLGRTKYEPLVSISFHFYTKSRSIADGKNKITYCKDPVIKSKQDYIREKTELLTRYVPAKSILLLDGPLVGGQITSENIKLNKSLLSKEIIPVFIVKNTQSSLVVDNVPEIKDKFNSDLEWAYKSLKIGQRTPMIYYKDNYSPEKNKVFTYIKGLKASPVRVELHYETYYKYRDNLPQIFNLIFYEIISQGNSLNPQPKIVAVAEQFARESLSIENAKKLLSEINIIPTINFTRFGW